MALRDWQLALARLVEARASGRERGPGRDALAGLALDDAERAWLEAVRHTRGFALTSFVPRWWRETRVRRAARLTIAALGDDAAARLADYLRAVPGFTLFFVPEGIAFAGYIAAQPVPAVARAVARFERAMWHARFAAPAAPGPAAVIAFPADPERVLAALLDGTALPEPTPEPHHVVVDPGVPGRWRPATADEVAALGGAARPASSA